MTSPSVLRTLLSLYPDLFDAMREEGRGVVLLNSRRTPWRGTHRWPEQVEGPHILRDGQTILSTDPDQGVGVGHRRADVDAVRAPRPAPADRPRGHRHRAGRPHLRHGGAAADPDPRQGPRILAHFALAIAEAERRGIRVECYSPISALLPLCPFSDRLERPAP